LLDLVKTCSGVSAGITSISLGFLCKIQHMCIDSVSCHGGCSGFLKLTAAGKARTDVQVPSIRGVKRQFMFCGTLGLWPSCIFFFLLKLNRYYYRVDCIHIEVMCPSFIPCCPLRFFSFLPITRNSSLCEFDLFLSLRQKVIFIFFLSKRTAYC